MDGQSAGLGAQLHWVLLGSMVVLGTVLGALLWRAELAPLLLLSIGIILLVWERQRLQRSMHNLASRLQAGSLDEKLEVTGGAWGELCRAVNGLVQQQRVQRKLASALPALPEHAVRALLSGNLPLTETTRQVVVIGLGCAPVLTLEETLRQKATLRRWQQLLLVLQPLADESGALLMAAGEHVLLVFGVFEDQPLSSSLRAATRLLVTLRGVQRELLPLLNPPLVLCSGTAVTASLPGLGFHVLGDPVNEALRLRTASGENNLDTLVCSEASYLALLQIGFPNQSGALRLLAPPRLQHRVVQSS